VQENVTLTFICRSKGWPLGGGMKCTSVFGGGVVFVWLGGGLLVEQREGKRKAPRRANSEQFAL